MTSSDSSDPIPRDYAWVGPLTAVVVLGLWCRDPAVYWLPVAAAGVVSGTWMDSRRRWAGRVAAVVLLSAILGAFQAHRQVLEVERGWPDYWAGREAAVGRRLDDELQELLEAGEAAAARLGELGSEPGAIPDPASLTELRERHGVTALALYDNEENLRVWDGIHRGRVPDDVQSGELRYAYDERPLFGYLYVTAPAGGVGTAVAAFLLRTDLPGRLAADAQDFASRFRDDVGEEIRMFPVPLAEGQGGWELEVDGRVLVSVVLVPPQPTTRSARILKGWRSIVFGLVLGAWLLLAVAAPVGLGHSLLAGGSLLVLAGSVPFPATGTLGDVLWQPHLVVPGMGLRLPLGRVLTLSAGLLTALAVLPRPRFRAPSFVAGAALGGAALLALVGLGPVATPQTLASSPLPWFLLQGAAVLLLTAVFGAVLSLTRSPRSHPVRVGAGVGLALLLGAGSAVWVRMQGPVPLATAPFWVLPGWLVASGLGGRSRWGRPTISWTLAALLAATLIVPVAWGERVEARRAAGEERLEILGAPSDPALEDDLAAMAVQARILDTNGSDGVDLLYGAMRRSGFVDAGHPVWLSLWSPSNLPEEELRVGAGPTRPVAATDAVQRPRDSVPRILAYDQDDARYVLRVPLRNGRTLTAAAPPFPSGEARSALSPLLMGGPPEADPLTLIPLETPEPDGIEGIRWSRSATGWRARTHVHYPDASYEAQLQVPLPGVALAVARGTLILLFDVALALLCWGVGRMLLREVGPPRPPLRGLVISFRARVTLALFGFFVLANAIFGTLAYRTIDRASHRTSEVLAGRVADDAAGWYLEESGAVELLARRVGAELLEYRGGELLEGSVEELVELGLYEGWVPFGVHRALQDRDATRAVRESALGEWQYVTAYRRLPDGDLLGSPVPIQAGATALGSTDVLQLLGFAVLVGAALSLGLALLVGQALTRPIQALQVASERVGAGNLELSLPEREADEFGAVFQAFNRMVKRLRRARRQLVRTTRRTQAIMEEAAVGIVALDAAGRVTLVNPRAERLLGAELTLGRPVPKTGPRGDDLGVWLAGYLDGTSTEAGLELHLGDRRIRVRARRLEGSPGGAVVALEDVTDELRTERVLAWGEMARQVAHEVKNPLTPMKLSIQHLRRAWDDERPDFGDILVRNAEAVLAEIDRLATIARSFSRFGAPDSEGRGSPLGPVNVVSVVREVMALYGASDGPVEFRRELPTELPLVRARMLELKEVLVNLLENAREALQDGGTVRVTASMSDGRVVIRVQDDGAGVPPELMPRVFEPHFSTRSGGTGLGLAIVRRLVESWGGSVSLESEPGQGAVVTLALLPWPAEG